MPVPTARCSTSSKARNVWNSGSKKNGFAGWRPRTSFLLHQNVVSQDEDILPGLFWEYLYHFKRIHQSGRDFTHFQNKTPSSVLDRCPQVESRKIKKASWARLILVVVVVKSGSKIERPAKFKGVCATFCLCPGKKKMKRNEFLQTVPTGDEQKKRSSLISFDGWFYNFKLLHDVKW